jgi:hypothetical protein
MLLWERQAMVTVRSSENTIYPSCQRHVIW